MNKSLRKKLGEKIAKSGITCGDIKNMLITAYQNGGTNSKVSTLNKGMSKAAAYNIFWNYYSIQTDDEKINPTITRSWYGARNAIVEFGEFGGFADWKEEEKIKDEITVFDPSPVDPFSF